MKHDRFSHLARANRADARRPKAATAPTATARTAPTTAAAAPPASGLLRVFLDDERPCPEGWTAVLTPAAFATVVEEHGDRIECLALDWHLGANLANGEAIAKGLARQVAADPRHLPSLSVVTLHSSDRERAISMLRILETAFGTGRDPSLPEVRCLLCDARETAEIASYLVAEAA